MATLNVEPFKHRIRLCWRQVLHIHAWERGVKLFLRDRSRLAPDREVEPEEAESHNETSAKEQLDGRISVELAKNCAALRHQELKEHTRSS
jgi:hypothetical protein